MAAITWSLINGILLTGGSFLLLGTQYLDRSRHRRWNRFLGWLALLMGLYFLGRAAYLAF